jgi:glycosyltransferase involved in cell wall biosynthesis
MISSEQKIVFVTNNSFPIGLALTNRILSLAQGVVENGEKVEVICVRPTESFPKRSNLANKGLYLGINYRYSYLSIRSSSFISRRYNDFLSILKALTILVKENRHSKLHIVFFGHYPFFEFLLILLCKVFNMSLSKEESELPIIYFRNKYFGELRCRWYLHAVYRQYDKIFVMTDNLKTYFTKDFSASLKIRVLPNCFYFPNSVIYQKQRQIVNLAENYILYAGSYDNDKDGIVSFLHVFQYIINKINDIQLWIVGDGTAYQKHTLNMRIEELKLQKHVKLLGKLEPKDVFYHMYGSRLLLSYRPPSNQSFYGFPTKLIEYLSTSRPVVTTFTGEIGRYLNDGENCFEIYFEDVLSSGRKIVNVLNNYDHAINVGNNGKISVETHFDAVVVSKKFLEELKS